MIKKTENFIFTIVGSGFGLYGYLPAIVNVLQYKVVLVERYRKVIETRPELRYCLNNIDWRSTDFEAMNSADGIIISVPPLAQKEIVEKALSFGRIKKIIIEKPLCPSPNDSIDLIDFISSKSISYRVGYTFLYTDWYLKLKLALQKPINKIKIYWSFKAHHFLHNTENWKRYHSKGGGALRFYGIHIIATLASFGYVGVRRQRFVTKQSDQPEEWEAQFYGTNLPLCDVHVFTNTDKKNFQIQVSKDNKSIENIINSTSPFTFDQAYESQDDRIPILEGLIKSLCYEDEIYTKIYLSTNNLWSAIEQQLNSKLTN